MSLASILWVDDEIEILEAHKRFLEMKGYQLYTMTNGFDAIEFISNNEVDFILLDESMPGMSGLETLQRIKQLYPHMPVVLVTKNETESLMEEAIGAQITDYLIKPVHPHQVLLTLKKNLENKRLVSEKIIADYQMQFNQMFTALGESPTFQSWKELYNRIVYWELEMEKGDSDEMLEILLNQKKEANLSFFKFISRNYIAWMDDAVGEAPIMSHQVFKNSILPHLKADTPLIWVIIDNFRLDQWKAIEPLVKEFFKIQEDDCYFSILPTATHYCRNALFAGMTPRDIEKQFPSLWKRDDDEDGKNNHEKELLMHQLKHLKRDDVKFNYQKIHSKQEAESLLDNFHSILSCDLHVIVYNFVDMVSHARNEMEMIKELATDERAYRSLTKTWFMHSPLYQFLKKLSEKNCTVVISTDHGSLQVKNPIKVVADKQTTSNLRYKNGKNLDVDLREVVSFKDPERAGLPRSNMSSSFIFSGKQDFFCYPNHFNQYANLYRNSFQHGGISMEEMIVPIVTLSKK